MSIQPDSWIKKMCKEHNMIEPFLDHQVSKGKISYGLSSMGYDVRISDEYRIFTNVNSSLVDPKNFSDDNFIERKGPHCIIPPNSFVLAKTVEYFRIPKDESPYEMLLPLPCFSSNGEIISCSLDIFLIHLSERTDITSFFS